MSGPPGHCPVPGLRTNFCNPLHRRAGRLISQCYVLAMSHYLQFDPGPAFSPTRPQRAPDPLPWPWAAPRLSSAYQRPPLRDCGPASTPPRSIADPLPSVTNSPPSPSGVSRVDSATGRTAVLAARSKDAVLCPQMSEPALPVPLPALRRDQRQPQPAERQPGHRRLVGEPQDPC